MHYSGMEAARFDAGSICMVKGGVDNGWLAAVVALASLSLLTITLLLSVVDSRLAARTAGLVRSLSHANKQLHHLALHDSLTRLPNRSLLEDRIVQAMAAAERSGAHFALMFLDLDRFKTINDSLGHHYGDKLLQAVAQRLAQSVRAEDTVARIGGDEFVVLLGAIGLPTVAAGIAQKLLDALAVPLIDRAVDNLFFTFRPFEFGGNIIQFEGSSPVGLGVLFLLVGSFGPVVVGHHLVCATGADGEPDQASDEE